MHEHLPSASSYNWFIDVATYRDDSYIFFLNDTYYEESYASHQNGTFRFFNSPPSARDGVWWLTNDLRAMAGNVTAFDQGLPNRLMCLCLCVCVSVCLSLCVSVCVCVCGFFTYASFSFLTAD